ncbi:MAG: hypothetical protein WCK26_02525 [Candidatus Saccharibacteria bacterium]
MQPEIISPIPNPERLPNNEPNVERNIDTGSIESDIEKVSDSSSQRSEANAIISDINLTTILPAPVSNVASTDNSTLISSAPATANDDDLIEKEWVDKAKKIVSNTKNDPHLQEEEVSKLQVDYIKKRFGRELGVTN